MNMLEPTIDPFVENLDSLLSSRSYEAFYDRVLEEMPRLPEREQLCLALHCADNIASLLGMPGITAESLLKVFYLYPNDALIEERLFSHLRATNNFNLLARAMQHKIDLQTEPQEKAQAYLEFGHFLQFSADDHVEAARSYYTSSSFSLEYALPGMISLQRLVRSDPSCNEAKQAINRLKTRLNFSDEQVHSLQLELNQTAMGDKNRRSSLLLNLATLHLQIWGDANKAIDFIEPALELTTQHHQTAFTVLNDIAVSMPDSLTTLRRIMEIFLAYHKWAGAIKIGEIIWKSVSQVRERARVLLSMAQVFAEHLDNSVEASKHLYLAISLHKDWLSQAFSSHVWIFDYSARRPYFRDTVIALIEEGGDLNLALKFWTEMSTQAHDRALCDVASIEKWRLEAIQAKSSDAFIALLREGVQSLQETTLVALFAETNQLLSQIQQHENCLNLLQNLAAKTKRWDLLINSISRWLHFPLAQSFRIHLLTQLVEVYERHLSDSKAAASICMQILNLDPLNVFAQERIDHIFLSSSSSEDSQRSIDEILSHLAERVGNISHSQDQSAHNIAVIQLGGDINALWQLNVDLNDYPEKASEIFAPLFAHYRSNPSSDEFSTKIAFQLIRLLQQLKYYPQEMLDFVQSRVEQSQIKLELLDRMLEIIEPMGNADLLEKALLRCINEAHTPEQSLQYLKRLIEIKFKQNEQESAFARLFEALDLTDNVASVSSLLCEIFSLNRVEQKDRDAFFQRFIEEISKRPELEREKYFSSITNWMFYYVEDQELLNIFLHFLQSDTEGVGARKMDIALIYEKLEKNDEARRIYEELMTAQDLEQEKKIQLYENYANLLLRAYDEIELASSVFDKAVALYPLEKSMHSVESGEALEDSKHKHLQSLEALQKHLNYCLSLGDSYSILAKFGLLEAKQFGKKANLVKLLYKQSSDDEYRQNLQYLYALLCENDEFIDEALSIYEELKTVPRFELDAKLGLLRLYRQLHKYSEIPSIIDEILKLPSQKIDLSALILLYAEALEELKSPPIAVFNRLKQAHFMLVDDAELSLRTQNYAIEHSLFDELLEMLYEDASISLEDEEKAEYFLKIAQIAQNHMHTPMKAFDALGSAFIYAPQTPKLVEQIEALAYSENNFTELIAFYRNVISNENLEAFHLLFLLKTAEVHAAKLNNATNAFETCCEIIRRYPENIEVINLMEGISQAHSRFDLLISFYSLVSEKVLSTKSKVQRLLERARLTLNEPLKIPKALNVLALALVIDPNHNAILHYLNTELQSKPIHWESVTQLMLNMQNFSPSIPALVQTTASIFADRLDNPEKGFNTLTAILPENITNIGFFQQAIALAERANKHSHLLSIIDDAILLNGGNLQNRNDLLGKKFQIADLIGDDLIKLHTLREILEKDPNDDFALSQINSINPSQLKANARILLLQTQLSISNDEQDRLRKQMQIADLYVRASQFNNAINLFHSIIDEFPNFIQAQYELLSLLNTLENWKSVENTLLEIINLENDKGKNFQNLLQLANLQDQKLLVPSRALLSLFAAIDIFPDFDQLHPKLCELSLKLRSFSPLLDKYQDLALHSSDFHVRKAATLHSADVYIKYLDDVQQAKVVYEAFLARGGESDYSFLSQIADFYMENQLWNEYIQALNLAEKTQSLKSEKFLIYTRIADTYATQLNDLDNAIIYTQKAVHSEKENANAWLALAHCHILKEDPAQAITALLNAAQRQSGEEKAFTLLQISQMHIELSQLKDAMHYFSEAIELRPSYEDLAPVAENIIALATNTQDQPSFMLAYEWLVDLSPNEKKVELRLQQAKLLNDYFENTNNAQEIYAQLSDEIDHISPEQGLLIAQTQMKLNNPSSAYNLYLHLLNSKELDASQKLSALQGVRDIAISQNDPSALQNISEQILEIYPNDTNAAFDLIQLYYNNGKWDLASQRIEALIPHIYKLNAENAALIYYYYGDILQAAELYEQALEHLTHALEMMPDFRSAVDIKLTVLLKLEKWRLALPVFYDLLELTQDTEVQGAIRKRIAELYQHFLNEPENAIVEYEQALVLGGDVDDVPLTLLQLYMQNRDWHKAAMTSSAIAQAQTESTEAKVAYLITYAEICYIQLNDEDSALEAYLEAFYIDPLHEDIITNLITILNKRNNDSEIEKISQHLLNLLQNNKTNPQIISQLQRLTDALNHLQIHQKISEKITQQINWTQSRSSGFNPIPKLINLPPIDISDPAPPPIAVFTAEFPPLEAFQDLNFSMDDLNDFAQFSEKNSLPFASRIIQDIRAIVNPNEFQASIPPMLPETLSHTSREKLLETQILPAAISKTIQALTCSPDSPALYEDAAPLHPISLSDWPQFYKSFKQITELLGIKSIQAILPPENLPNPGLVLNTIPPALILNRNSLMQMTEAQWNVRAAYASALTLPNHLLYATLTPTEIHDLLQLCINALNTPQNEIKNADPHIQRIKNVLHASGINKLASPILEKEKLENIKKTAQQVQNTAAQIALQFTQSFYACVEFLSSQSNMRFPQSINTLKSNLKRNTTLHELMLYALSKSATLTANSLAFPK